MMTKEITSVEEFKILLDREQTITSIAVQNLDLRDLRKELLTVPVKDCLFLGCRLTDAMICRLQKNNYIFPTLDLPYPIYPNKLYTAEELYASIDLQPATSYEATLDKAIYDHFIRTGKYTTDIKESLARSLHDQSITNALQDFIQNYEETNIMAIMGGHGLSRSHENYRKVVHLSKNLTESGKLMVSGGGPGAMEATHLGAWLAGRPDTAIDEALAILTQAPLFTDNQWLSTAWAVISKFPIGSHQSLGIPTWLYGHEPPTPFASHIAKYFTNSIREDGLLAIAKGGVIFTPGSAGTVQEVFQEVTQNHYLTLQYASPMIFFDSTFWTEDWPVYPLLKSLADSHKLKHLNLGLYDDVAAIQDHLKSFFLYKNGYYV
ncbi:LOG family protein [Membranihabitans marinus]|uniref:LOG family protein n=1 Tax=Membranihabitans marinus TaxID=1227546 RepID=UPI001F2D37AA|nr:hypothetical protein [Membranihabitans marinus]